MIPNMTNINSFTNSNNQLKLCCITLFEGCSIFPLYNTNRKFFFENADIKVNYNLDIVKH